MTTACVTGCGGFIGNILVRQLLKKGYKVKGLDNFHKGHCDALLGVIDNPNFDFIYGDVTNPEHCDKLVQGCDIVFHLAALVGFPACANQPSLARLVNIDGTRNIINARNKISKSIPFLYQSTGSVYGALSEICTENSPCNTNTVYGITKLEAEKIVVNENNIVVFRHATAFGPSPGMRVNLLVNDLVFQAIVNKGFMLFEPDFKRTFIHIDDFCKVNIYAAENMNKFVDKIYNSGDESMNFSKRELAEIIKKKTNCVVVYAEIGKDLDVRNYSCDFSRLHSTGFNCETSMEKGIEQLIKATSILRTRNPYA